MKKINVNLSLTLCTYLHIDGAVSSKSILTQVKNVSRDLHSTSKTILVLMLLPLVRKI